MKSHLISMAGAGSKFEYSGYDIPKPLIKINGKLFSYWAYKLLSELDSDLTFIQCVVKSFALAIGSVKKNQALR